MNDAERVVQELDEEGQTETRRVTRKRLIDSLNYLSFQKKAIMISFEHTRYRNHILLRAYPQPCSDDALHCIWAEPCPAGLATAYTFQNFMVDRELELLIVEAELAEVTANGITFRLPGDCRSFRTREARRYSAKKVQVSLMQEGSAFSGTLEDFTALSFRVVVSSEESRRADWVNDKIPFFVVFLDGSTILYTGECRLIRRKAMKGRLTFVFRFFSGENIKPQEKRIDSDLQTLVPQPGIVFDHPLARKRINLKIDGLAPCRFSVTERYDRAVLFPGLVLPQAEIEIAPGFSVTCKAQVASGDAGQGEGDKVVKWSIVILDMGIEDQGRLFSLLQRAKHQTSHACGKVDVEDLLKFFFDTGLVYPKKYAALQFSEERFRATYKRLYLDNPAIARHFMQIDKGVIQGHLAMLRFYENTWMLHHHAALGRNAAGLAVLNQVRDYVNDYRHFYSSHMDYLICYFRPNNRFPNRVFGGFSRALGNPKVCSTDAFAYMTFSLKNYDGQIDDFGWRLEDAGADDLSDLSNFYDYMSGGLLVKALDLGPEAMHADTLSEQYTKLGFTRQKRLFALKKNGMLKAVVLAVVSDAGLNLSNLTNCVHVFVIDGDDMPVHVLYRHLALLSRHYAEEEVPVLLYPLCYADEQSVSYEKIYNLWAFDTRRTERFYEYMERMMRGKRASQTPKPRTDAAWLRADSSIVPPLASCQGINQLQKGVERGRS